MSYGYGDNNKARTHERADMRVRIWKQGYGSFTKLAIQHARWLQHRQ